MCASEQDASMDFKKWACTVTKSMAFSLSLFISFLLSFLNDLEGKSKVRGVREGEKLWWCQSLKGF